MIQKNWQELIKPKKLESCLSDDLAQRGDDGRRAARARLRPDARQRAAPHAAVVAAGRGDHLGPYRRRAARILLDRRRARGRHRHRAQHQGHRHQDAGRGRQAHGAQEAGSRRGHRRRHPDRPATSQILNPNLVICTLDEGAEICAWNSRSTTGKGYVPADRNRAEDAPIGLIAGRQHVLAGEEGLLPGREHARGPGPRLRQADDDDRDQRRDVARGRARLRRAHPAGPARSVRQLRGAAPRGGRSTRSPSSPSIRRCSRRSTSSSFRCAPPTA